MSDARVHALHHFAIKRRLPREKSFCSIQRPLEKDRLKRETYLGGS